MGPHPGRKKLIVRTFEKKPSRYAEKVAKVATAPPTPPPPSPPPTAKKPEPQAKPLKERVPDPRVNRKPGLSVAEQHQRKRARLAALAWLKTAYPALFGYPPRPLAVGIGKLITPAAREAGVKREDVGAALHYFTRGQSYLEALAADGAMRFGLTGEPVGPVEPDHQREALKLLAVIVEIKARRSAPVDQEDARRRDCPETRSPRGWATSASSTTAAGRSSSALIARASQASSGTSMTRRDALDAATA